MFRSTAFRAIKSRSTSSFVPAAAVVALSLSSESPSNNEKLSIYPHSDPDIILLDTPSPLELQIGILRRRITDSLREARNQVQSVVDKWIGVEHAVETRVKSVVSPNEEITPGLLYTGISTLTGSIIARNRSIPTRMFLPGALFLFSLHHFLPQTTGNLKNYLGEVEERYLPHVAQKHAIANAHTSMLIERVKEGTKEGRERMSRGVSWGVHKVQELTGLKLSEVLKSGKEVVSRVERKVEKEIEEVGHEAREIAETVIEKNVQQIEDELDKKV